MKKLFRRLRKDNSGVTLILAIVAVGFVGILASAIVSATATNYKLKMMDKYSKETFYSADSITEEIRAGVGMKCFDALSAAYNYAAKNLLDQTNPQQGTVILTDKNNEEANKLMKQKYKELMGLCLFEVNNNIANKEYAIKVFNSFISHKENAKVIDYAKVTERPYGYLFEDLTVEYKQSKNNPYFSTVTVDMEVTYPDIEIDFIAENKDLKTYLNYCLIAMNKISAGESGGTKTNSTISGGAYAGEGGFDIISGSVLTVNSHIMLNGKVKVPSALVTNGDIDIEPSSVVNVNNSNVWCKNYILGDATQKATLVYNSTGANTYVADDLTLEGNGSTATIKGKYIGFGSNNSTTSINGRKNSSAIIINGKNCTLNMLGIDTLLLAGKAYIELDDETEYRTGDSLALKGNQEIYLVPESCLSLKDPDEDPMYVSNPSAQPSKLEVDLTDFFAYKLGLLSNKGYVLKKAPDSVNGGVTKTGKTYFYLDFKDKGSQNEYVKCVIQEGYLEEAFKAKGIVCKQTDTDDRDAKASIIDLGVSRFFDSNTDVQLASGAKVYTSGTLMQVTKGTGNNLPSVDVYNGGALSYDDSLGMATSTSNKYKLMNSFLGIDESLSYATLPTKMIIDGAVIDVEPENQLKTIYERVVDVQKLSKLDQNIIHNENGTIAAVICEGGRYTVPANVTNGVILGYGVDIVLDHNFEGLIITNKSIYLFGSANPTTGSNNRAEMTLDVYDDVAQYFYIFQEKSSSQQIGDIGIDDLLKYSNWRKNEDVD